MKKVATSTRLLSYLYPVCVDKRSSATNPVLDLYLYRNQWQLATADALYSDGSRYRPLAIAFQTLKEELHQVKNLLVLGTGLGSAVRMLHRLGYDIQTTLVDIDEEVMKWALELMPPEIAVKTKPVCEDARNFLDRDTEMYDMVIVDIFLGRVVPDFVYAESFLEKCRRRLNPGGRFVLNYIVNNEGRWKEMQAALKAVFPNAKIVEKGINRIIICK